MGKFALKNSRRCERGFTLVEMLVVLGIMLTMMAMLIPAINDVMNSKGRKAAVNMLLNSFEQARVTALQQSTNVYVGFADKNIPDQASGQRNQGFPYTRFIIFRDRIEDIDGATAPTYIALTKWMPLPKGISFKSGTATVSDGTSGETIPIVSADKFPSITQAYSMPVVKFNTAGVIEKPGTSQLWLFIYEGFYEGGADVFTRAAGNSAGYFERISFARYTGRAQLDITSLSGA